RDAELKERIDAASEHPTVRALLDAFPGAQIEAVRDIGPDAEPDLADDAEDIADIDQTEGDI
ncbi:MAG: hypothetical protein RLN80_06615, partial [Rhodospirillales bacterium]